MPITGGKKPLVNIGNRIWDSGLAQWIRLLGTGGSLDANIARWGGTVVTGRDVTQDLRALSDESVPGLSQAIGLPTGVPVDATLDETARRFLERIAGSVDTIGALAGLLRTLGDVGAAATAPTTSKSAVKILEDILTALGGVGSPQWDSYFARNTGAAPFAVTVDSTVDGGRTTVSAHASMPVLVGNNATVDVETSNDNVNWVPEFTWTIVGGGSLSQNFANARRYMRMNATAVAGGVLTLDLASSR